MVSMVERLLLLLAGLIIMIGIGNVTGEVACNVTGELAKIIGSDKVVRISRRPCRCIGACLNH